MFRLMIVDDEQLEIDALRQTIDYRELGICDVLEANNIRQAKELFLKENVDILLCDVEMPQGSGFELLRWVKTHSPKTECIFITCHADFCYAKQAIQLGSLDYLLKPAQPVELKAVIEKAMTDIESKSQIIENAQFSKLWLKHQPLLIEHFWLELLSRKTPANYESIQKAALEVNFPGLENIRVLPVLIRTLNQEKELDFKDEKLMAYALKNIAQELILKQPENGFLLYMGHGSILVLFYLESTEKIEIDDIGRDCEAYIAACNKYLRCDLSCYLGNVVHSHELADQVDRLMILDDDNVAEYNQVFRIENYKADTEQKIPDMLAWFDLLELGEKERLLEEIDGFMQSVMNTTPLCANILRNIQRNFMQIMGSFLNKKGIIASYLFKDDESAELFSKSTRSIHNMTAWMKHDTARALDFLNETEKSRSVAEKVKLFIAQNIERELSCEEIASSVFLNPIYLSRIFKRETGLGLSEYLQQEKFNTAKNLLVKTRLPVCAIATRLGYTNFSHFSRMFKKYAGMSPVEFRNRPYENAAG